MASKSGKSSVKTDSKSHPGGDGDKGDQMANMVEIQNRLADFDHSLNDVESTLNHVFQQPHSQLSSQLSTLDKAKFDLLGAFAMTSLFWMYLNVNGVNVNEHPVKQELDRIKNHMSRARAIQEKANAPKVDKEASKRLVRNALWDAAQKGSTPKQGSAESGNTGSKRQQADVLDKASEETKSKKRKR